MLIYWFESVIIGFFHALAMRQAPDATDPSGYTPTVSEFCLQYATYVGPVGIFVFGFFVFAEPEGSGQEVDVLLGAGSGLHAGIGWAVAGLLLGHALAHFLPRLPGTVPTPAAYTPTKVDLIYRPFPRVIAMHATIFLGGLLVVVTGWASAFLGTFVAVKTLLDLYFGRPPSAAPAGAAQPPTEPPSS